MSGDVVNLRRARKARARSLAEAEAKENRQRFGIAKSVRTHDDAVRSLEERRFEAHRREPAEPADDVNEQ